jgi:hypothetical protein
MDPHAAHWLWAEVATDIYTIRRVPWDVPLGRFGVSIEDIGLASRVDDVLW